MKKTLPLFAVLALIFLASQMIVASQAVDYTKIGVRTGDAAVYSTRYTLSVANRSYVFVSNAVDTFANLTVTDFFADGSLQQSYALFGNVSRGDALLWYWLIPAYLNVGDLIYDGANRKINDTLMMRVCGASRSVNHVNYSSGTILFDTYYDRGTGIMVKQNIRISYSWGNRTMISTNMWQPDTLLPDTPLQVFNVFSLAWLVGGLVVGSASAALLMRARSKKT
jgi:hypothetical protein